MTPASPLSVEFPNIEGYTFVVVEALASPVGAPPGSSIIFSQESMAFQEYMIITKFDTLTDPNLIQYTVPLHDRLLRVVFEVGDVLNIIAFGTGSDWEVGVFGYALSHP